MLYGNAASLENQVAVYPALHTRLEGMNRAKKPIALQRLRAIHKYVRIDIYTSYGRENSRPLWEDRPFMNIYIAIMVNIPVFVSPAGVPLGTEAIAVNAASSPGTIVPFLR